MHKILKTDHYKLTMGEAGWPFRQETFYYSHRRGGPYLLPFDPVKEIKLLNPLGYEGYENTTGLELSRKWLVKDNNTQLGSWFYELNQNHFNVNVQSVPAGSWIFARDPMFVVTGPSFAVSWIEPLVLQWNYRIQLATLAIADGIAFKMECSKATTHEQKKIINETIYSLREMGFKVPNIDCKVLTERYYNHVKKKVKDLVKVVGDPSRIFEVGMRSASCMEQHSTALVACRDAGVTTTSNVWGAKMHQMKSMGTMGHEHIQRYGSDKVAFRAMVERLPGPIFFLLDTFDTIKSGIPNALQIIAEQPERNHAIRFDSGDIRRQFIYAAILAKKMGIRPRFCLEDSWNLEKTIEFEKLRKDLNLSHDQVLYGYGGHIVNSPFTQITRDRASAVWKMTQSGENATMKFGAEPGKGKESIPGKPVLYWSEHGTYIAQRGENIDKYFGHYQNAFAIGAERVPNPEMALLKHEKLYPGIYSPKTKALVRELTAEKDKAIKETKNGN